MKYPLLLTCRIALALAPLSPTVTRAEEAASGHYLPGGHGHLH